MRDPLRTRDEEDRLYGRLSSELTAERTREFREKCITGRVFEKGTPMEATTTEIQKVREFAECYTALQKDAAAVLKYLEKRHCDSVFVRIDGDLHLVRRVLVPNSWEIPVTVRPAQVLELMQ